MDPGHGEALAYLESAERRLNAGGGDNPPIQTVPETPVGSPVVPASFAAGRYVVEKFLGEGGKKRGYLAHDTTLDRDVAFALIKTEGLDEASRQRVTREAQAMDTVVDFWHGLENNLSDNWCDFTAIEGENNAKVWTF